MLWLWPQLGQNAAWSGIWLPQCVQYNHGLRVAGSDAGIVPILNTLRKNNIEKKHRLIIAVGFAVMVFGALAVLRTSHPHEVRLIPDCPSITLAGLYCPGCGSLRATHHLLHGRVSSSLAQNPLTMLVGVPVFAIGAVLLLYWALGRPAPAWTRSRMTVITLFTVGILLVVFGAMRNINADWARWMQPTDQRETR